MSENDHCLRTSGEQLKFLKLAIKGCKLVKENKKITQSERGVRIRLLVAERKGFEPLRQFPDDRISSAARYDHFDISPI